jgi:hypothetical protein
MPMFSYGPKQMGKVDVVRGLGHVETTFLCAHPFPLWPLESHLVLESGATLRIPLSWKSAGFVYLRASTLIVGLAMTSSVMLLFVGPERSWRTEVVLTTVVMALFGLVVGASTWLLQRRFEAASPEREAELRAAAATFPR